MTSSIWVSQVWRAAAVPLVLVFFQQGRACADEEPGGWWAFSGKER